MQLFTYVSPSVIDGGGLSKTSSVTDVEIGSPEVMATDPVALNSADNHSRQFNYERTQHASR